MTYLIYETREDRERAADRILRAKFWKWCRKSEEVSPRVVAFAVVVGLLAAMIAATGSAPILY